MIKAVGDARSDDSNSIKDKTDRLVVADPENEALLPPIDSRGYKADRGFNHPILGKMLAPMSLSYENRDNVQ